MQKTLQKIKKKDPVLFKSVRNKIKEIINAPTHDTYKNLKSPLQAFKRIHITGSYILIFQYVAKDDTIVFVDFDHWDAVYQNLKNRKG